MNSFQKTIKYCAMAFAIFLAVGIISFMINIANVVIRNVSGDFIYVNEISLTTVDFTEEFDGVTSIKIDNSIGSLIIKKGDVVRVEAESVGENFKASVNNGTLTIIDKQVGNVGGWFNINKSPTIILYLPENFVAKKADINSGAGKVTIDYLVTDNLIISTGAGSLKGKNIVANKVSLNGGVGKVNLTDVNFTDAIIECGVGKITINGQFFGSSRVNCGVGKLTLKIDGDIKDYNLNINAGLGTVHVNGEKVAKNMNIRDSSLSNSLQVDGGVGSVNIDFVNK